MTSILVSSGDVSRPMQEALRRTAVACADSGARLGTLSTTAGLASLPDLQATVMAYEAARSLAREAGPGELSDALLGLLDQGRAYLRRNGRLAASATHTGECPSSADVHDVSWARWS